MKLSRTFAVVVGLALCASAVVGCGGAGKETVAGKITLDGAPLTNARITLLPQDVGNDPKLNLPYVGSTDDQGHFSLGPLDSPAGGVPPGAYRLSITTAYTTDTRDNAVAPPERVPQPYSSGVDFTVPDGGASDANFDLKSK
jgi:hypothetical protein